MTEKKFELSLESNIMEVLDYYPNAAKVFVDYGLPCIGCVAAHYESIKDITEEFGIDGEALLKSVAKSNES